VIEEFGMRRSFGVRLLTATVVVTASCSFPSVPGPADGRLAVLATTSIIADAVKQVGGDRVRVECLMGPGVDPHRYQPSAGDVAKIAGAKVVFFHGLHLEGKMTDVLARRQPGQRRLAVAERIDPAKLRKADAEELTHDPHVWFDPALWAVCVGAIAGELAEADPDHAAEYRQRADAHLAAIRAADDDLRKLAESLPPARRILVTSHDAFGYFGAAYGFQVHGLQGVSTQAESGTKDVAALAAFLGTNRVPAVFAETSVPPKGLQAVLDAVRSEYRHEVRLIGGDDALLSDALGEPGTPGDTYLGMIRHNMTTIVTALR
jgi:manganese/zinc/iron transport system substrate-binding protein